jgi:hypothetical protein
MFLGLFVFVMGIQGLPSWTADASESYSFSVPIAPYNMNGSFPFTMSTKEYGDFTGQLNLSVGAKGAVTGTVICDGDTYPIIKGKASISQTKVGLAITAHQEGLGMLKFNLKLSQGNLLGKFSGKGPDWKSSGTVDVDVSSASAFEVLVKTSVSEGEKGVLTGTGTASWGDKKVELDLKGKVSGSKKGAGVTLSFSGDDFKFSGKGVVVENGYIVAWKAKAYGAQGGGSDLSITKPESIPTGWGIVDSPGKFELAVGSTGKVFPTVASFQIAVINASIIPDPEKTSVTVNGFAVSTAALALSANSLSLNSVALKSGSNIVKITAVDNLNLPLSGEVTVFAGTGNLTVVLKDGGEAVVSGATVTAYLADDHEINWSGTSNDSGEVLLSNIPDRTIIIQARKTEGNLAASGGATGVQGTVTLTMLGFNSPSSIANNDISLGTTAGWETGSSPVSVVTHVESSGLSFDKKMPKAGTDYDLVLGTSGEGPQFISRTFTLSSGTSGITVRYKFVTSEVPGGYFGSKYNDYFGIIIRTLSGGGFAIEANSMNGLGLAAFDASGATAWRTVTLPVNIEGDTVQVNVVVANVADGVYDSQVIVDKIVEQKVKLNVTESSRVLLESNTFEVDVTGATGTISAYKIQIRQAAEAAWYDLASTQKLENYKHRIAGKFKVRGMATINGEDQYSPESDLEVMFPTIQTITANADVSAKMTASWADTLNATTATARREEGFHIKLNTTSSSEKYEFTATVVGPMVDNATTASVPIGLPPADSPATINPTTEGATYSVAVFHTHTPTVHRAFGRAVGPSGADIAYANGQERPLIAYDYVGNAAGVAPAGHPLNSPAKAYFCGPNRRPAK